MFYLWLMVPTEYNGSLILYRRIIRPKFLQYSGTVDNLLDNAKKTGKFLQQNIFLDYKMIINFKILIQLWKPQTICWVTRATRSTRLGDTVRHIFQILVNQDLQYITSHFSYARYYNQHENPTFVSKYVFIPC